MTVLSSFILLVSIIAFSLVAYDIAINIEKRKEERQLVEAVERHLKEVSK